MTQTTKTSIIACALGLLMIGGAGLPSYANQPADADGVSRTPPSVLAMDQKIEGKEVLIEYAYVPTNGYLILYGADKDGKKTGEPIGQLALNAGDHRKLKVQLTSVPPAGSALWASLYANVDGKPGIDPAQDKSVWAQAVPSENRFYVR